MLNKAARPVRTVLVGVAAWQTFAVLGGLWLFAAPIARADGGDEVEKRTHTISFHLDYTIPVNKSSTVGATDFGAAYRAGITTYAGKSKALGLGLRYDSAVTRFTQSDALMKSEWTDFAVSYKLWMIYPTIILGSVVMDAESQGEEVIKVIGISRGGGFAARFAAGALAIVHFEALTGSVPKANDGEGRDVGITNRIDAELGVSGRLPWNNLDITTGYRYRGFKVVIDGEAKSEIETGPYLGFNVGFSP